MCSRAYRNFNVLKKEKCEDRPFAPEQKAKQKRKRVGEMFVSTDKLDRLTLEAATFRTHSDEEVPLRSQCFSRLANRSTPSIHLCWQVDDTHPALDKSAELISAISKVVSILKSLDTDDDPFPAFDSAWDPDTEVASASASPSPSPSRCVRVDQRRAPSLKEPLTDCNVRESDNDDLRERDVFVDSRLERIGRCKSRPKYKAHKPPASTSEETRFYRRPRAGEDVYSSKRIPEFRGGRFSTFDSGPHGTAFSNPAHKAAEDDDQEAIPFENEHEISDLEAPRDEPPHVVFTPRRDKEHEFGCGSEKESSDCGNVYMESEVRTQFNTYNKPFDNSDKENDIDDDSSPPEEEDSEERVISHLKTRRHEEVKLKEKRTVHFKTSAASEDSDEVEILDLKTGSREKVKLRAREKLTDHGDFQPGDDHDQGAPSRRSGPGDSTRFINPKEKKFAATSKGAAGKGDEGFLERRKGDAGGNSSESSDDDLLYEDEMLYHDSIKESSKKNSNSRYLEEFTIHPISDLEIYPDSKVDLGKKEPHDENMSRQKAPRVRRRAYDVRTLDHPEVDEVFNGPRWKTFNSRLRVKTILDQFHYLVNHYRWEASTKERVKKCRSRPDIQAGKYLMAKRFCFNEGWSVVGSIPGVEVGDTFMYREELLILIVHRTSQAGIEYIPAQRSGFFDRNGNPAAVAVSVVSSGGYKDTQDDGETLIYVGSGGDKNLTNSRSPASDYNHIEKDQELVRGNLALKNSCDLGVPVRVVRGEKQADGDVSRRSYWYDGLYDVTRYYEDKGSAGSKVWKFQLVKQKGQRES